MKLSEELKKLFKELEDHVGLYYNEDKDDNSDDERSYGSLSDEELGKRGKEVNEIRMAFIKCRLDFDDYKRNMKLMELLKYSLSKQFNEDKKQSEEIDVMIENLNEEYYAILDEEMRRRNNVRTPDCEIKSVN